MHNAGRVSAVKRRMALASARDQGDVVLSALLLSLITSLLVAALVTVVTYQARIVHLQTQHERTYWAAKGEAVAILKKIRGHESIQPQSSTTVADVRLTVSVTGSSLCQVTVTAQADDASTTIVFAVSSATGTVVSWKEDQPMQ
jgi:Tfp pilus assembly protein PilX